MRARAWYFWEPSNVYAVGPFRFAHSVTERTARAEALAWLREVPANRHLKRLPNGCAVWPTS